jgi:hypothetical protein
LKSSEMSHLVYRCSLSSAVSRFCICLASISRSRCSFLALHEAGHWIIISYSKKRHCDHGHQVIIIHLPHNRGRVQAAYYCIARGAPPRIGIS